MNQSNIKYKKRGRKVKKDMPVGESIYVIVPPEVMAVINRIYHERNSRIQVIQDPGLKMNKKAIYNELIRRGIETYYGGVDLIPVEQWDTFMYDYRKREELDERMILGE